MIRNKTLMQKLLATVLMVVLVWSLTACGGNETTSSDASGETNVENSTPAGTYEPPALDASLNYYADIDVQDYGTITVLLEKNIAPITCANFVELAESGFYDGLTFHRIMAGFMMQGGDPNGDGTGGSENEIFGEFAANGWENGLSHTRGVISMARAQDLNSASSQFFICHEDSTFLDGGYAAFGYVTEGLEIVDAICEAAEPTDKYGSIEPSAQPVIKTIQIRTQ